MTNPITLSNSYVFGLDIGTRSIVGVVGYKENDKFHVVASQIIEHDTRAMIDGQIHDIEKVSETVRTVKESLEKIIGQPLREVCIAAAGRVLKTANVSVILDFPNETLVNQDHVYSLELQGVEEAHHQILESDNTKVAYHCVGYSVVKYYLNDYMMSNLVGHKAKKISAEVLATFLPQEVIDSLYQVIEKVGLKVVGLTLEPIAAINVAIPEQFRLLNIALVDIGAGTSDIAITKDGSIIAYGMIPYAGDEITEQIVHQYLVDFQTAEKIKLKLSKNKLITFKDIMGTSHKYEPNQILEAITPAVMQLADKIAEKILELNGLKPTNAVFCVGGGGQINNFTTLLSERLKIPTERVALRGAEVLQFVQGKGFKKEPAFVTPIGIALSGYNQNSNFIEVFVNEKPIKIYNNNHLTVIDVAAIVGFNHQDLFPKRGNNLTFEVNGTAQQIKGQLGEAAKIIVNEKEVSINYPIQHKDNILLLEATRGNNGTCLISELKEYQPNISFSINGQKITCPRLIRVNGKYTTDSYNITNNDSIEILDYYPLDQLLTYMDLSIDHNLLVNGQVADRNQTIKEQDEISWLIEEKKSLQTLLQETINEADSIKQDYSITINVNGNPIILKNKQEYIFVDIFDYLDFDLSRPKGSLITKLNGKSVAFTDRLKHGDQIELHWER